MPIRCGIYVRISDDRAGEGLGVRRQELECRTLAGRLGWAVVEVYCDNDVSAYARKKRKNYERMLADVRDGRINAIVAWAPDRLHRKTRELVGFIDLVTEYHVEIQTVRGGQIDLSTAIGRMTARTLGTIAEFESEIKQERILAKIDELVRDGKVHNGGPRPFGYRRIYVGEGPRRKIVRDEVDEVEAGLIREARDRVLNSGESLYSICADWNTRGIRSSTGRHWSQQAMKLMLISGRIAGLKEHRRQVVGKASWPAIISAEDHRALRARLMDASRSKPPTVRKYWLTGIVHCGACTIPMRIVHRSSDGAPLYQCPPPKVGGGCGRSIVYGELEKILRAVVIRRLSDPRLLAKLAARRVGTSAESRELADRIEADERRLRLLQAQLEAEDVDEEDLPELMAAVRAVRRRIRARRSELAELADAGPLVGVDVGELVKRWGDLHPDQQAGLARVAGVGRVEIGATRMRGRFDPGRIELVPIEG